MNRAAFNKGVGGSVTRGVSGGAATVRRGRAREAADRGGRRRPPPVRGGAGARGAHKGAERPAVRDGGPGAGLRGRRPAERGRCVFLGGAPYREGTGDARGRRPAAGAALAGG